MKQRHDFWKSLAIAGLCFVFLSILFSLGFLSNIQNKLADNLYGGLVPLDNIVIVSIDDKSLQEIGRWPWDRKVWADTVDKLGQAKVVGMDVAFFEESNNESDTALAKSLEKAGNVVLPVEYTSFVRSGDGVIGKDPLFPIEGFKQSTTNGFVNIQTDRDGVTRSVNLAISGEVPSFTNQIFLQYSSDARTPDAPRFLINFVGKPGSFKRYSVVDVKDGTIDPSEFANKLVIIGATAQDLHDTFFVPTSQGVAMPGAEIHANILQTLITRRFLIVEPLAWVIFSLFLTCALVWLLLMKFSIRVSGALTISGLFLYVLLAIFLFETNGVLMNLVIVPIAPGLTYTSLVAFFYATEKKHRKFIHEAFGKYVSPDLIEEMINNPERLKLGGETREITVFFSDIRGFTGISEILTAEQLVHFLNDYLTEMTNIILGTKGTVDKYMGDAIMAFWNAPLDQPGHPHLAAQSSLDQMKRLIELQGLWKKDGLPYLDIGIGLNTGSAVVGNMGSYDRFDYTAMGDTINLGSRLEGTNKQYGTNIIVSNVTYTRIKDKFLCRPIDKIRVKGRKAPLMIFELLESHEDASSDMKEYASKFEEGVKLYYSQEFDKALKLFTALYKKYKPLIRSCEVSASLYVDRCKDFKKNPPGKSWDGVYTMTTK